MTNDLHNCLTANAALTNLSQTPSGGRSVVSRSSYDQGAARDFGAGCFSGEINLTVDTTPAGETESTDDTLAFTNATETVTWTAHPFEAGDRVQLQNSGTIPTGLAHSTDYFVVPTGANTFQLATTRALALAGTADVTFSSDGSGTRVMQSFPDTFTFEFIQADDANLTTNVEVIGQSAEFDVASIVANRDPIIVRANPAPGTTGRRYLGLRFKLDGSLATGAFTAYIALDPPTGGRGANYPIGYTVQTP